MILNEREKQRLNQFRTSDVYKTIEKLAGDIKQRSWMMRKTQATADETLKVVSFGEGVESGVNQLIELINKYSK